MPRPDEIEALIGKLAQLPPNPDAPELLPAMMRTRGLNPSAVRKLCAGEYVALELSCTGCGNPATCRHWLAARATDDAACRNFCPNAEQLARLRDLL